MDLTKSELRTVERVRRAWRWRVASAWVLGTGAVIVLGLGAALIFMLVGHLREHGVPVSDFFTVLLESQHPSQIQVLFVCSLAMFISMVLILEIQLVGCFIVFFSLAKERRLLLKLLEEEERRHK